MVRDIYRLRFRIVRAHSTRQGVLAAAFVCAVAFAAFSWAPLSPDPQYARIARTLARILPEAQLDHAPMNEQIATNALRIYLSSLDYDHSFFLTSDIAEFEKEGPTLADRLRRGDVSFAYAVFNRFMDRVSNRVAYVEEVMDRGFDLETRETYRWKRKDAPWPADEKEWNDLWRRKIQHEYISQLVGRKLAEENGRAHSEKKKDPAPAEDKPAATNAAPSPEDMVRKRYRQFLTVLSDNDAEWVLQRYLSSFTLAYDPHSDYMTPSTAEDFDIGMKLSLGGIGALLSPEDGAAKIERIIPGSPADKDGRLKAGDKIIAVAQGDGEPVDVLHWPLRKTVQLIRGQKGTKVVLTVIPASDVTGSRTVKIGLIRDEVKLEEQAAKGAVEEVEGEDGVKRTLGVIHLPTFYVDMAGRTRDSRNYRSSLRDVRRIVTDMVQTNVEGIVLDLRNNGGGSLPEAVEMTGLFLGSGPVVQVKERRGIQVLGDPDSDILYGGPLIVLVNRQSASASEILAAALQDYGRAVIVGDSKTHGKGTVQSLIPLDRRDPQMGSLKVTAATFYRIAGGSTQLKGVIPDVIIPSALDTLEIGEEFLPHALPWSVVTPALYKRVADLGPMIVQLRERSEKRRKASPAFQAEQEMLDRLSAMQKSQDVPLNLQERIALSKAEKSLSDLEREVGEADGEAKPKESDLIRQEALRILADMVELQNRASGEGK